MIGKFKVIATAVAISVGSMASAAVVDFTGLPTLSISPAGTTQVYFGDDSTGITVAAFNGTTPQKIRQQASGIIGAPSSPGFGSAFDGGLGVDGGPVFKSAITAGEVLQFTFPAGTVINNIFLSRSGPSLGEPAFATSVDGVANSTGNVASFTSQDFSVGATGSVLNILNSSASSDNGFFVSAINYTVPSEVPLPAGGVLLLGALVGGAVVARRRKKAA